VQGFSVFHAVFDWRQSMEALESSSILMELKYCERCGAELAGI
jgi:hypothetical protein